MVRIPALYDKSTGVDGRPITSVGGAWHNDFGGCVVQNDFDFVFSDGSGQYVDTGSAVGGLTAFDVTIIPENIGTSEVIVGMAPYGTLRSCFYLRSNGKLVAGFSSGNLQLEQVLVSGVEYDVSVDLAGGTATIDGESVELSAATGFGHTSANTQLFARIDGSLPFTGGIGNCVLYKGTSKDRDMTPIKDGQFVDKENSVVYGNDGSGALTSRINASLAGPSLWSDDGLTFNRVTTADRDAQVPYTAGVVQQWDKDTDCVSKQVVTYESDKEFTPSEYIKTERWRTKNTEECGADALVPAEVTVGTGIGPDLDWADNGDGEILLVEDA